MSVFTTEVRYICEMEAGLLQSQGQNRIRDIISTARPKIFDFPYPIFDENYKQHLEEKILRHFYTREICVETYGLWKLRLEDKMNEIMPYYNQLYLSEGLKFEPLFSDNYTRKGNWVDNKKRQDIDDTKGQVQSKRDISTHTTEKYGEDTKGQVDRAGSGSTTGQTSSTMEKSGKTDSTTDTSGKTDTNTKGTSQNTQTNAFSNTPQSGLADVAKLKYLTDYRVISDNGTTTGESHSTMSDKSTTKGSNSGTDKGSGNSSEQRQNTEQETSTGNRTGNRETDSTVGDSYNENSATNRTLDSNENANRDYFETITGYANRSASSLLLEFRETFLNIDQMILKDLEPLFFGLWA